MGDTCGRPPPRVPPTYFSTIVYSARDLIYRGFVGGQMLSVSCSGPRSTKLTSSAATAHALSIGSMSATLIESQRKLDLTFSTLNNQISGTTTFVNAWCPGMTVAVSTSIKGPLMVPSMLWLPRGRHNSHLVVRPIRRQEHRLLLHSFYQRADSSGRPRQLLVGKETQGDQNWGVACLGLPDFGEVEAGGHRPSRRPASVLSQFPGHMWAGCCNGLQESEPSSHCGIQLTSAPQFVTNI